MSNSGGVGGANMDSLYADYNSATLNMRAQLLLKQQQQIQIMNTLLKQQQQHFSHMNTLDKAKKSPSSSSMRRKSSLNASKKSKKSLKKHDSNSSEKTSVSTNSETPKNYYLLPNMAPNIGHTIYNDNLNLLTLEAAFNQNLSLFNAPNAANFYLLNQPAHTFSPSHHLMHQQQQQMMMSPSKGQPMNANPNGSNGDILVNIFETKSMPACGDAGPSNKESSIYESSDMDTNANEQEPMLTNSNSGCNHYASSGLLLASAKKQYSDKLTSLDEQRQLI